MFFRGTGACRSITIGVRVVSAGTQALSARMRCKARTVNIATFNINNINKRLENLLAWLDQVAPDVVCLQELKAAQETFPVDSLRALGKCLLRSLQTFPVDSLRALGYEAV